METELKMNRCLEMFFAMVGDETCQRGEVKKPAYISRLSGCGTARSAARRHGGVVP
jgi:hypothetical protein